MGEMERGGFRPESSGSNGEQQVGEMPRAGPSIEESSPFRIKAPETQHAWT